MRVPQDETLAFRRPGDSLSGLDAITTARVLAAAADIALVVDRDGVVRDLAAASAGLVPQGAAFWIDRPWASLVTLESRPKVEEMLRDAAADQAPRWREVNHIDPAGESLPLRYLALQTGVEGQVIAIGRDLRAAAQMQQRLLQAQQALERDYARLRQTEQRYRLLFQLALEAVLIVDVSGGRVIEANPAAQRMLGVDEDALIGQPFSEIVEAGSRDAAIGLIAAPHAAARSEPLALRLRGGEHCLATASLFRQARGAHVMVRLFAVSGAPAPVETDARRRLFEALERLPDAFIVTDEDLRILAVNAAFLDFTQLAGPQQAENLPLERFLGRPGVDLKVLSASLREHGVVRNFATVLRSQFEAGEEVEVSAVSLLDGRPPAFAFSIRSIGRRLRDQPAEGRELPRSVGQLTSLVGRVSLKEIVRETTDRIERLCIEAALELTADNRASAAELLGLSRQSFYSKLHRHGLGNLGSDEE